MENVDSATPDKKGASCEATSAGRKGEITTPIDDHIDTKTDAFSYHCYSVIDKHKGKQFTCKKNNMIILWLGLIPSKFVWGWKLGSLK